ncbi:MAG: protein translocase subunit SecF [Rhodothermales bacterium]|nr:protein translocase subunit SecF [Rhodothermales bacterium]
MRILENSNIAFVPSRSKAYVLSAVLIVASIVSFATKGLEMGIDFQGGMEFVVATSEPLDAVRVREALSSELGGAPEVKTFGQSDLLVRTLEAGDISTVQQSITQTLAAAFPESNPTIQKTDIVGPRFAADLKRGAIYSVLGSLLVIFVYILIRFEWRFGLGAVTALFHDVTITLGVFSILHGVTPFSLQVDQTIIAAFLTIVGYSLNDTVVIFDRIREYANIFKTEAYPDMVNRSINHTMSRTIVTSGTTLLVVVTLFIFGGEVLKGFAFALIIGILIGTYSSVFVAAPVVVELKARGSSKRKSGK